MYKSFMPTSYSILTNFVKGSILPGMKTKPQPWCLVFHFDPANPTLCLQRGNKRQNGEFRAGPYAPAGRVLFEISFSPDESSGWEFCWVYDYTETEADRDGFPYRYLADADLERSGALARLQELMVECQEGKYD